MGQTLLPIFPSDSTRINEVLSYAKREGTVWYFHACLPVFSHDEKDYRSFNMYTSQLVASGQCKQVDIVKAFGVSVISVKRHVKKFREGGPGAFFQRRSKRRASVFTPEVLTRAQEMLNEGRSRDQVSKDLSIKPDTLYRAIQTGKLVEISKKIESKSERSIEEAEAAMGMGCTRVLERVMASVGQLSEAQSRFKASLDVSNAGVLWALPALLSNGLLRHTKEYFDLPKGFYSQVHVFLLLAFMALSRIKTNERLRFSSVGDWGLLLGLDRIPEVRTLREKIKLLSDSEKVSQWAAMISKDWMDAQPGAAGTLYIDGHVRVYHGTQTKLPRRYVSRDRLCLRGMTDYWVNDQQGRPFFVISTPFTTGLLDMLRNEIVPRLLKDVPLQHTEEELASDKCLARFTLVFDREGYSPEFFKEMWETHRIACITYNKYPKEDWSVEEFQEQSLSMPNGESITMKLTERRVYIGGKQKGLWVREIRKLTESGHQTSVITTEFKAEASDLGLRMFARWSQENFFKYMMEHFNIDRLICYKVEQTDETKKVVNPAYRKIEGQIKSKAGKLGRKLRQFAEITLSAVPIPNEIEKFERNKGELIEVIALLKEELVGLKEERKKTKKHTLLGDLPEQERFSQLESTRKQFIDTIKMIAYRAETAMAIILSKSTSLVDDTRALLRSIYTMEADIIPDEKEQTLTVRLHHLSNPSSDKKAQELATHLNETETIYPGTNLRLHYELVSN